MRLWILLAALFLGAAAALPAAKAEKAPPYPQNVQLQAKAGGRYLLTWDPIFEENLMGYSIWMRKKGAKEFTRLSVPVKVGKEVQKQPMTTEARLELKLGEGRKDLEFSVLAEYEDGPSERSDSVFSAQALPAPSSASGQAPDAAASGASGQALEPAAAAASAEEAQAIKADPYADEKSPAPVVASADSPWNTRSSRQKRELLLAPGKWRTSFGLGLELERSIAKGVDPFYTLGLSGTGIPLDKTVTWRRVDVRTRFKLPLKAQAGLFPGLELSAETAYHAEDVYIDDFLIDGDSYDYIRYARYNDQGEIEYLPNASSAGLGDSSLRAHLQPLNSLPLVLTGSFSFPTGISRFKSYIDWRGFTKFGAGTGNGVERMEGRLDWGYRGLRPGLSLHALYSPGTTERYTEDDGFSTYKHLLVRGAQMEAGLGYTFPWQLLTRDGAVVLGAAVHSTDADKWTIDGTNVEPYLSKSDKVEIDAHTGVKFQRDDQLEFSVDAMQDLPGGFETGGRFFYRSSLATEQFGISGRLVY